MPDNPAPNSKGSPQIDAGAVDAAGKFSLGEDWLAVIVGLTLLALVLTGLIPTGLVP